MPLDLSDTLVIGISATALFDMTESDSVFRDEFAKNPEKAVGNYRTYMLKCEKEPLADGTGMPLFYVTYPDCSTVYRSDPKYRRYVLPS